MRNEIFTIGYSSFSLEGFISTLERYEITALADVRSAPYSQYKPEFNREALKDALSQNNIAYVFLGEECGARINAPECYVNGKVDFQLIAKHPLFQKGLSRLKKGMVNYRIALMCAEKDPINCHRTILVCRNLRATDGISIQHILDNGELEDHSLTEKRLIKTNRMFNTDLIRSDRELIEEAYDRQAEKIAYKERVDMAESQPMRRAHV